MSTFLFWSHIGPEVAMPLVSAIAGAAGAVLVFGKRIGTFCLTCVRSVRRR